MLQAVLQQKVVEAFFKLIAEKLKFGEIDGHPAEVKTQAPQRRRVRCGAL